MNKMNPSFFENRTSFQNLSRTRFKFIPPDYSRINLKNFVRSLQLISLRVSRLRLNSCLVMEMFPFVFNDSIVKKFPLRYFFKIRFG